MKVDATPSSPVASILFGISVDVTMGGDHVIALDTEDVDSIAAERTKMNPRKWVLKKCESNLELDQLNLKAVVLHNSIGIHFTVGKHWVAREMNHFLLEKVQYLLSNAQLDKLFLG